MATTLINYIEDITDRFGKSQVAVMMGDRGHDMTFGFLVLPLVGQ